MIRVLKWIGIALLFLIGIIGLIWNHDRKNQRHRRGHH